MSIQATPRSPAPPGLVPAPLATDEPAGVVRAPGELSDEALGARAGRGDRASFGVLIDRYERRLGAFVMRRASCTAGPDLDDLVQEAFVRAWGAIARYDERRRFSTWLFSIAARVAVDHWRARSRRPASLDAGFDHESAPAPVDSRADSEERADQAAQATGIWALASEILSPESHAALWLRYAGGLGIPDIARVLGRSAVGTRVLLFRARERLAQAAGPMAYDHSAAAGRPTARPHARTQDGER